MKKKIRVGNNEYSVSKWTTILGVPRASFYYRKKKFGETLEQAVAHFVTLVSSSRVNLMRADKIRIVWDVYREWLEYDAKGDGVFKCFDQWLLNEIAKIDCLIDEPADTTERKDT